MNASQKREVVACLIKAGRKDLARMVVGIAIPVSWDDWGGTDYQARKYFPHVLGKSSDLEAPLSDQERRKVAKYATDSIKNTKIPKELQGVQDLIHDALVQAISGVLQATEVPTEVYDSAFHTLRSQFKKRGVGVPELRPVFKDHAKRAFNVKI